MDRYLAVFVTAGSEEEALALARAVVEEGLAACVNVVGGCKSVYRWKGGVEEDDEVLMLAKTTRERFEAFAERVVALHSYDTPEVISVPLSEISEGYRRFLDEVLP